MTENHENVSIVHNLLTHSAVHSFLLNRKVSILLNVTSSTDHIRLHTKLLNVSSTKLSTADSSPQDVEISVKKSTN